MQRVIEAYFRCCDDAGWQPTPDHIAYRGGICLAETDALAEEKRALILEAAAGVSALAQQRGWQYRSHRSMKNAAFRLADEYDDPLVLAGFLAAERFHIHFFHQDLEDYEIELNRPVVHRFVNHMLALLNGGPGGA
jgi:hypothetical protein